MTHISSHSLCRSAFVKLNTAIYTHEHKYDAALSPPEVAALSNHPVVSASTRTDALQSSLPGLHGAGTATAAFPVSVRTALWGMALPVCMLSCGPCCLPRPPLVQPPREERRGRAGTPGPEGRGCPARGRWERRSGPQAPAVRPPRGPDRGAPGPPLAHSTGGERAVALRARTSGPWAAWGTPQREGKPPPSL